MMKNQTLKRASALLLCSAVALATGCAAPRNPTLERAQVQFNQAQQNPMIQQKAPIALQEAEKSLSRAELVWQDEGDSDEVAHQVYLMQRNLEIAQAKAQQEAAGEQIKDLADRKTEVLLEARDRELEALRQELAKLKAQETERGLVITLDDVLFEVDSANLRPQALQNLAPLAAFLRDHPERNILIEGHTDNTGTDEYNLQLSRARAESVQAFLMRQSVPPTRMAVTGYGESYPIASNDNATGRQLNRRVEIVVLDENADTVAMSRSPIIGIIRKVKSY